MTLNLFSPVWPETTVFWGAGATASLGFPPTAHQAKFLHDLASSADSVEILQHIDDYFCVNRLDRQVAGNMRDLLVVLGADSEENRLATLSSLHRETLLRLFPSLNNDDILDLVINLRIDYDFDALKRIIAVTPYNSSYPSSFLVDLFNVIDMHLHGRLSFNVDGHGGHHLETLSQVRLQGARNCLVMLVGMMIQGAYHGILLNRRDEYEKYVCFSRALAELMQEEGLRFSQAGGSEYDRRDWYLFSYALISMNFDPILLWLVFNAHREANEDHPPYVGSPCRPLKLFNDLAHFMATRNVGRSNTLQPWYPHNEAAVQRINDPEHFCARIVRLGKLYFPHGCYCWRECPSCGKLIAHLGDEWSYFSETLFPPMPLQTKHQSKSRSIDEDKKREMGRSEVLQCNHCGALTYTHHTQPIMQTLVKGGHPSFLEEIARDMRACLEKTRHIVLLGYSLPPDDMTIRTLLASRKKDKYCTVVVGHKGEQSWMYGRDLLTSYCNKAREEDLTAWGVPTIQTAMDIFGADKVRAFTGGIPQVFEFGGDIRHCVQNILYPTDVGIDCFTSSGVVRKGP